NDGREEGDGKQGGYHGTIAENRFSGMYGEDFRYDSHGRKNYNIYLGVTQEPEKVFKEHGISALMAQHLSLDIDIAEIKRGAETVVHKEEENGGQQNGEGDHA